MKLFDSHCHLDDPIYDNDFNEVIERAKQNDVAAMMIAGVNRSSVEKAVDITRYHPMLYAAVGVHPHDAKNCSDTDLRTLGNLAPFPKSGPGEKSVLILTGCIHRLRIRSTGF